MASKLPEINIGDMVRIGCFGDWEPTGTVIKLDSEGCHLCRRILVVIQEDEVFKELECKSENINPQWFTAGNLEIID